MGMAGDTLLRYSNLNLKPSKPFRGTDLSLGPARSTPHPSPRVLQAFLIHDGSYSCYQNDILILYLTTWTIRAFLHGLQCTGCFEFCSLTQH